MIRKGLCSIFLGISCLVGDFIERVVTQYEFTTLTQSRKCRANNAHPSKKYKRVHSAMKVVASIFWDSQWVIMIDYLDQGCTINGAYYAGKLKRLSQETAKKRRGKLIRGVLLLQDNAPVHMTTATKY